MNLPKGEDGHKRSDSCSDSEAAFRRRLVIGCLAAPVLLVAAAAALVGSSVLFMADPTPHFQRARDALRQASRASAVGERHELARQAEAAIEESLNDSDTAKLLRAAAIACRIDDPDISFADKQEFFALREQIQLDRCPTEDLVLSAEIFADRNQLAEAEWLIENLLQRESQNPAVLRLAIEVAYFLGREKDVLRRSETLAELDPDDPFAWQAQAYVAEDGGHPEAMIDAYRELLRRAPHAETHLKLIEQLIEVGDARQARQQFTTLRDAAPELLAERPALEAELLLLEGESRQARQQADEILARTPNHPGALLLRAKLALQSDEIQQAQKDLEQLLERDPINTEAHYLLGQTYNRLGVREKAMHHLALQRKLLDTRVRLHQLERRAAHYPHDAQLRRQIAVLYSELGAEELAQFWRRAAAATDAR